jgi:hypothetical protein
MCAAGGMIGAFVNYGFSAVLDAHPVEVPGVPYEKPSKFYTFAALGGEMLQQFCAFPWFITAGTATCDDADGRGKVLWIIQCFGVLLDVGFVWKDEVMPENDQDPGVIVSFLYGVCHLCAAIPASVGKSGVTIAANILAVVPELTKLLRLTAVVAETETISLKVQAGIDGVFGFAASLCGLFAALEAIESVQPHAEPQRLVAAN